MYCLYLTSSVRHNNVDTGKLKVENKIKNGKIKIRSPIISRKRK